PRHMSLYILRARCAPRREAGELSKVLANRCTRAGPIGAKLFSPLADFGLINRGAPNVWLMDNGRLGGRRLDNGLESIYRAHRSGLFALALAITRSKSDAEDAVHDAVAKLSRSGSLA